MRPLIISRKSKKGFGGLSRFYAELSREFPNSLSLSPESLDGIFRLAIQRPTHIYLCDATLLPLGIMLKKLINKPLIVTAHGLDITYKNPFYQKMVHSLLPQADAVVLDSLPTKKLLRSFKLKNDAKVIPLGITTRHLEKSEPIRLPTLKNKVVLSTVGNLVKRKGHVWFISKVMPFLPTKYVYFVIGEGRERQEIEKAIRENNLTHRVFLLGQLTHKQLNFMLKHTTIYIAPNQYIAGNFESFGIAAGEATALGIPVVASNVDGISQAIQNGKNGLLIPPTPESFIKALNLLKDPILRKKIGAKAKNFTKKNYQWSKTAQQYFTLFASFGKN